MARFGATIVCVLAVTGCSKDDDDGSMFGDGSASLSETGATSVPTGGGGNETSSTDAAGSSADSDGTGIKFDTPGTATGADDGGISDGCDKVDFLFVIDNSISMGDEQQNLANGFPQFIQTIQTEVVSDYHVMVIDTDGEDKFDEDLAECHDSKCIGEGPNEDCGVISPQNMWTCGNLPPIDACDPRLGAGIDHDDSPARNSCGLVGGMRWFDDTQPDPDAAFECIANLYAGNSPELTMDAMLAALGPSMVGNGGCNEGFLRDDAVLVVTFITDEEDNGDSMGDPASWYADLLALKGGNETAVVVLGLLGDTGLPNAVCPPDSIPGSTGGEYSPRLIEFVESFGDRGLWGSVCAPDYGPFFQEAVGLIDFACEEYTPEG